MIIKAKNNELPPKRKGKWALALLFVCALICAVYPHYPIALKPPYFDYTPLLYFLLPTGIGLVLLLWLWRTERFAWVLAFSYIIISVFVLGWFWNMLWRLLIECDPPAEQGIVCREAYPDGGVSVWLHYEDVGNLPLLRLESKIHDPSYRGYAPAGPKE